MAADAAGIRAGRGWTGTPLAMGVVSYNGATGAVTYNASPNVQSIAKATDIGPTGIYRIVLAGESLDLKTHVCMITSVDVYGHDRVSQDGAGNFLVYLGNNSYIAYDHSFAFVIYKM